MNIYNRKTKQVRLERKLSFKEKYEKFCKENWVLLFHLKGFAVIIGLVLLAWLIGMHAPQEHITQIIK